MKLLSTLFFILLLSFNVNDVPFIGVREFHEIMKDRQHIHVVEFWAEWNAYNQCNEMNVLHDCKVYRVNIDIEKELVKKYGITVVPTVFVINQGIIIKRIQANVMFQIDENKSSQQIQDIVDKEVLKRFR